jgi:hypothetical protein
MAWINKGDLFEAGGATFLAMEKSYMTRIIMPEDAEAFNSGIDMSVINEVVYAAPVRGETLGNPYRLNLHQARNVKLIKSAEN